MPKDRSQMTVRIVPLNSREASEAWLGGTVTERLAVVAELTALGWALTKLPLPRYTRATMPGVVTSRSTQNDDDWRHVIEDLRDILTALPTTGAADVVTGHV